MAFKLTTTNHDSTVCPGVTFKLFRKTYGRRMELDKLVSEYNQNIRGLAEKRTMLLEQARAKAIEVLGGTQASVRHESVIKISKVKADDGTTKQVADAVDPQTLPGFQTELYRHVDWKQITELDEQTQAIRLAQLRPIYMGVYLHSVNGLEAEDGTPIRYTANMGKADKDSFYQQAPAELIDEIFLTLDSEISLNEVERANFELPTTGGPAAVPAKTPKTTEEVTTATSAGQPDSGDSASVESLT